MVTIHTIILMPDDTPDTPRDDSHPDFMFGGNDADDVGVARDMDNPIDTTTSPAADEPVGGRTSDEDTTEMPSVVEAAPFDYDRYYESNVRPNDDWTSPAELAQEPGTADRPRRDGAMYFVGALAAALLGSALTVGVLAASGTLSTEGTEEPTATPTTEVSAAETSSDTTPQQIIQNTIINEGAAVNPAAVATKTLPSIVTIQTSQSGESDEAGAIPVGTGSGVVITEDGYIATNEHVVADADTWTVRFEDGRIYPATLIGDDSLTDLAVLKIEATGLSPIEFGSLDDLQLGDPAVAVGNPLGQEGGASVSSGIVSAFNRRVDFSDDSSLFGMIQTDAAINNGSSGGALVDAEGELIGITAAIGVSQSGPEGIGYAIPVNMVQRITAEIIETGDVVHPFLGVTISDHLEAQADGALVPSGSMVQTVEPDDAAAAAAGLEPGDVIVEIDGESIASQEQLIVKVRLYRVGDEVEFVVLRGGERLSFDIVLGERPDGV